MDEITRDGFCVCGCDILFACLLCFWTLHSENQLYICQTATHFFPPILKHTLFLFFSISTHLCLSVDMGFWTEEKGLAAAAIEMDV